MEIDHWKLKIFMKNYLFVANWKMNTTVAEAEELIDGVVDGWEKEEDVVVLCPPACFLEQCSLVLDSKKVKNIFLGAQNVSWEQKGAITGDISVTMVKDWVDYAIVGHSERRQYFSETAVLINKKIKLCFECDINPVLCVGEKRLLSDDITEIGRDLSECLAGLSIGEAKKISIAYEPVWAIGTGEPANPNYVNRVIRDLRAWVKDEFGFEVAESIKFLYGGSVDEKNSVDYLKQEHVDGLLIGGASLKKDKFLKIVNFS